MTLELKRDLKILGYVILFLAIISVWGITRDKRHERLLKESSERTAGVIVRFYNYKHGYGFGYEFVVDSIVYSGRGI